MPKIPNICCHITTPSFQMFSFITRLPIVLIPQTISVVYEQKHRYLVLFVHPQISLYHFSHSTEKSTRFLWQFQSSPPPVEEDDNDAALFALVDYATLVACL